MQRYMLIPRTLVFLTKNQHVLLIKGAPDKRLWANRFNGIGGHIERGEDVLTAARREVREETGLQVRRLWLCGTVTIDTGQPVGIGLFVFRGLCEGGAPRPSAEGVPMWVPAETVFELPLVEDLHTLLPRVLAMTPTDPPFAALYVENPQGRMRISFAE